MELLLFYRAQQKDIILKLIVIWKHFGQTEKQNSALTNRIAQAVVFRGLNIILHAAIKGWQFCRVCVCFCMYMIFEHFPGTHILVRTHCTHWGQKPWFPLGGIPFSVTRVWYRTKMWIKCKLGLGSGMYFWG